MKILATFLVLAAGCLDDPAGDTNDFEVAAARTALRANGFDVTTVTVTANTDDAVVISASTGAFVGGDPQAGTVTVKTNRDRVNVVYRAGLDVGPAVITATTGDFQTMTMIELTPNRPTEIAVTASRTRVTGDGVAYVDLVAEAIGAPPGLISHDSLLRFGVCCVGADDIGVECEPGEAPLIVATFVEIDDGRTATTRAITTPVDEATSAIVRARVDDENAETSLCSTMPGSVTSNDVRIDIEPEELDSPGP